MRNFILLTLLGLFTACGHNKIHKDPVDPPAMEVLSEMRTLYLDLFNGQADADGFIETQECDSLMMTGLANPNANITAAEESSGKWLRRPVTYEKCAPENNNSASTISRDMLLGLVYWAVINKDAPLLKRLYDYGEHHNWVMGEGDITRTFMTPVHVATLAQALYVTSDGKYDYAIRQTRYAEAGPAAPGFTSHLQAVGILIRYKVYGSLLDSELAALKAIDERDQTNPLFAVMNGRTNDATNLLINTWPRDRLPTTNDLCESWRPSREPNDSSFRPCPEKNRTFSGGDFLFVSSLVLSNLQLD